MSSKLTASSSPSSSYCLISNGSSCPSFSRSYNLSSIKILRVNDPFYKISLNFAQNNCGISSVSTHFRCGVVLLVPKASSSPPPSSSSSSSSPSRSPSSWKKWLIGILLTVVLPIVGHKGGLILALKGKIDEMFTMVENVTEIVEEIAEEADKLVDEVEKKLPDDSKLKETLESFNDLTKVAVKEVRQTEDFIKKMKDTEKEIAGALLHEAKDSKTQ